MLWILWMTLIGPNRMPKSKSRPEDKRYRTIPKCKTHHVISNIAAISRNREIWHYSNGNVGFQLVKV